MDEPVADVTMSDLNPYERAISFILISLVIMWIFVIVGTFSGRFTPIFLALYSVATVASMNTSVYNFDRWAVQYDQKEETNVYENNKDIITEKDVNNFIGYPDPEQQLSRIYEMIRKRESNRRSNIYSRAESQKDYNEIITALKSLSLNPHL